MSIESNDRSRSNEKEEITDKERKREEDLFLLPPSLVARLFVPLSHIGGKQKMSSTVPKPSPNPELSKKHVEILKKELGIVELKDKDGGNHKQKEV
jgi:hypothetical protein